MVLLLTLIFLLSFSIFYSLSMLAFNQVKTVDKLKHFDEEYVELNSGVKKEKLNFIKSLSKLIPDFKFNGRIREYVELELIRADLPLTYNELVVIKILISLITGLTLYLLTKNVIIAISLSFSSWSLPTLFMLKRKIDRIKRFDSQLSEAIVIVSNSLKAGYSFLQAVSVVGEQVKEPLGKEFKRLLKEMSLGLSEQEAFYNLQRRVTSEDLNLLINAILIQKDIGGNLAEILDNITETIRERQKIKNELKTLTAQGKLTGAIISLLPLFLGVVIYLFNREYIMLLFTTKIGLAMVIFSFIFELIGIFMIMKIINVEL
ncbi:type II secretion system F family protein [Caloramator sp. ALD01]|uniref:type II secretion system F family protein n=1 Tax=Caloramator sp. ALD01 TaxID=1031288 RepID=UPI0003F7485B|nr:type II secretion system F family protein [Caloramator sp. ALD01]